MTPFGEGPAPVDPKDFGEFIGRVDERTHYMAKDITEIKGDVKLQNGRLKTLERWRDRMVAAALVVAPFLVFEFRQAVGDAAQSLVGG